MGKDDVHVIPIVDDDESRHRAVSDLLTSVGFGVETFASVEDFLQSGDLDRTGCVVLPA